MNNTKQKAVKQPTILRAFINVLLLLALMTLSGCAVPAGQSRAVMDAVADYPGCHFELTDLRGQLRAQARGMTGYEDTVAYTLGIRVPDYSQMNLQVITYATPAIDYDHADYDAYMQTLYDTVRQGADALISKGAAAAYIDTQLTIQLTRKDRRWSAVVTQDSERHLYDMIGRMMMALCSDADALPQECRFVRIASRKDALLASLLGDSALSPAFSITGIEKLDSGKYRMQLSYAAPDDVFDKLCKQYIDSFHERVFGSVNCHFDTEDYIAAAASLVTDMASSVTVSLTDDGRCRVVDGQSLADEYHAALANAQAVAGRAISRKWEVLESDRPAVSTLLIGTGDGDAHFSITLSSEMPATYIRLFQVDGSVENKDILQAGLYVLPDEKALRIGIPPGTYKIMIAWGDIWYGPEYMFGPDGHYAVYEGVEYVDSGVTWSWWDLDEPWDAYRAITRCPYDVDISH